MPQSTTARRIIHLLVAALLLPVIASAQAVAGHWAIEHPAANGLGSWYEFRADGTFFFFQGAMVTSPIKRSGNTITLPPPSAGAASAKITFRVDGDVLHLISPAGADVAYNRIGSAPSATDALLGKWRPVPPKTPSTDPKIAIAEKRSALAFYVFGADNTYSVRIPFSANRGTWDSKSMTYQFQNDPSTFEIRFDYGKLMLGQPPDGKKMDTYIPDPIL